MTESCGPFRAIEFEFTVESQHLAVVERLSEIFLHLGVADSTSASPIVVEPDGHDYRIVSGDSVLRASKTRLIPYVVSHVNQKAAASRLGKEFPVLHAAGVALDDGVIILPGRSGSGKSTLSAGLVHAGFQYLADELLAVRQGGRVFGYPKAITLKDESWAGLPVGPPDSSGVEPAVSYVRHEYFGGGQPLESGKPELVLFPTHDESSPGRLRELTPADTLVQLLETAYVPLSAPAFRVLAEVAASTPAGEITYPSTGHALALVRQAMDEGSSSVRPVSFGEPVSAADPGAFPEGTLWADFGDELVAANIATNAVVQLDAEGAVQWRSIAGGGPEQMASGLVDQLRLMGILA